MLQLKSMANIGDEVIYLHYFKYVNFYKKKCRWNSDCTCYLFQDDDDTNMMIIQRTIFRPIVSEVRSCLSMAFNGRSKVNDLRRSFARKKHEIWKSKGCHRVERKARITKMCTLCKFAVPVFGQYTLKCATYNFNGACPPCSCRSVGVTRTCFVD